jgi:hypothetical protein
MAEDLFLDPAEPGVMLFSSVRVLRAIAQINAARALPKMEESVQLIQRQQSEVIRDLIVEFNEKALFFYQMWSDNNQNQAMAILLNAIGEAICAFFADPGQGDVRDLIASQGRSRPPDHACETMHQCAWK